MNFLRWSEELSVNINSIDTQHKKLIELIANFYENIKNRTNGQNISVLIKGMKDYTTMHFGTEERYMRQYNYPEYELHKREHDSFIAKVKEIEDKFNNGHLVISFEITNFLKEWIKKHILEIDKKYSDFFIRHGIS